MKTDRLTTQPTIKDVAERAGVSIATVDRALHNRGRVSRKSIEAISNAIEELSYKPNQIARALSVRRSGLKIGVTYPVVESEFWAEVEEGIAAAQTKLEPFGVEIITERGYRYDFEEQLGLIKKLLDRKINALVLMPSINGFPDRLNALIPPSLPYATVIEDVVGCRKLFHIGPDDFAIGSLAAKLTYLFSNRGRCNLILLAANREYYGIQQRISGFLSKVKQDALPINILSILSVPGETETVMYREIYRLTKDCIGRYSELDSIYVTNGLTQWCADAVRDAAGSRKINIIGHEFTSGIPQYLDNGIVSATIYQKPALQYYIAICRLFEYLCGIRKRIPAILTTECNILIKESLPFAKIGEVEFA